MRVLFWFCDSFAWAPAVKALPEAGLAESGEETATIVAFIHVEPQDMQRDSSAETKLVKNAKWLARKWQTKNILLHAFNHLGERKTEPAQAKTVLDRVAERLEKAGYHATQTPYGYFLDLVMHAPGNPLGRIYKEF